MGLKAHPRNGRISQRWFSKRRATFTVDGAVRPGLHRVIKDNFFPRFGRPQKGGGGSSRKIGSLVDDQLSAYVKDGRLPDNAHKFTRQAVAWCKKNNVTLTGAQHMIFSEEKKFATAIDLVGTVPGPNGTKDVVLIEVKTGYARGVQTGKTWLKAPLDSVRNNQHNHHQLQLLVMDELLRREYDVNVKKAVVLYLQVPPSNQKAVTAKAISYVGWCNTKKARSKVWAAIGAK